MKRTILAGISEERNESSFQAGMEECAALCQAGGYDVIETLTQKAQYMNPKTAFRSGKLDELKKAVQADRAEIIVFYNDLSIQTAERISSYCAAEVIDRTSLILNIFSLRARTRQAKLQVEMARMQYALPRIRKSDEGDTHRERGGAVTNRGSGEMRSEVLVRQCRRRIRELSRELDRLQKNHDQDELRRNKTMMKRAAIVGYTNAGKSSFMNAIMAFNQKQGNSVFVKDQFFATLDTSVRLIETNQKQYLLYDTVGFVSHLPQQLLDAFHTTLASAADADLLIHIIDASDPDWMEKAAVTEHTLKEIGAGEIPVLKVYNKMDQIGDKSLFKDSLCISCKTKEGLDQVRERIVQMLYPAEASFRCYLPYARLDLYDKYKKVADIRWIRQDENGALLQVSGREEYVRAFAQYRKEEENESDCMGKNR